MTGLVLIGLGVPCLAMGAAPQLLMPPDEGAVHTATPFVSGIAAPRDAITVEIDGAVAGTATADLGGAWSVVPAPLVVGVHRAVAWTVEDGETGVSEPHDFTVSDGPPEEPVWLAPADGSRVNLEELIFAGSAEPGLTVIVRAGEERLGTADALPSGLWAFTPLAVLERGEHAVTAQVVAPGDRSSAEREVRFTALGTSYFTFGCSAPGGDASPRWALVLLPFILRRARRPCS